MPNKQSIVLRAATIDDVVDLLYLWQAKQAVRASLSQSNIPKTEKHVLGDQIANWLDDESYLIYVGMRGAQMAGYIIGHVGSFPLGLTIRRIGLVVDLTIDGHIYSGGLGRSLCRVLWHWFDEKEIQRVMIPLLGGSAVEEAFWRSLGADYDRNIFWMDI
ncbi:MAG: hypothetical protein CUN54_03585 [Phototrophicales bacterium]|nr:MAG: hypothetical protein CUN54_03585 [Phototrophicales bacterium]